MTDFGTERKILGETSRYLGRVDELPRSSLSRAACLSILTSPEIMSPVLLEAIQPDAPPDSRVQWLAARVLRKRLGSRQVVAYELGIEKSRAAPAGRIAVVGKRYSDLTEGERAFSAMRLLWAAGFGEGPHRIPRPLAFLRDFKLLVQEHVKGELLSRKLESASPETRASLRSAGRWLARLHCIDPREDGSLPMNPLAASLQAQARELARAHPHLEERLEHIAGRISGRLASCGPIRKAIVHGDYQPENIFALPGHATVIDFDRTCLQDPAHDLGYFMAQTSAMCWRAGISAATAREHNRAFLLGYLEEAPPALQAGLAARISAHAAGSLLEILYYVCCVLKDRQPRLLEVLLDEAARLAQMGDLRDLLSSAQPREAAAWIKRDEGHGGALAGSSLDAGSRPPLSIRDFSARPAVAAGTRGEVTGRDSRPLRSDAQLHTEPQ